MGPSEFVKVARKLWKLGKVERTKSTLYTKEFNISTLYYVLSYDVASERVIKPCIRNDNQLMD